LLKVALCKFILRRRDVKRRLRRDYSRGFWHTVFDDRGFKTRSWRRKTSLTRRLCIYRFMDNKILNVVLIRGYLRRF